MQTATAGQNLPALNSPHPWPLYLVPGGEAAATLIPRDLGMCLPGYHTVQVQGLSFGHMGGGGLDVDGLGQSWGCGHNGWVRKGRLRGCRQRPKAVAPRASWPSWRCSGLRGTDMAEHQ